MNQLVALPLFSPQVTEKTMNEQPSSPIGGLTALQLGVLTRALTALENLGVSYAVTLPDGSEKKHGTYAEPPKPRRKHEHRRGELQEVFLPYVKDLPVGGYVVVPRGNYPAENMRGAICGYCSRAWGQKTYTTAISADGNGIELIRHDGL